MGKIFPSPFTLPESLGFAWLACCADAALDPQMLTDPRAEWEPDGVASLTRRKSCCCPDKVTLASCHYLPGRQEERSPIQQPLVPGRDQLPPGKGQTVSTHE